MVSVQRKVSAAAAVAAGREQRQWQLLHACCTCSHTDSNPEVAAAVTATITTIRCSLPSKSCRAPRKQQQQALCVFDCLHTQVDEVKGIMMQNVEQVLVRGERLDVLVDRTDDLRDQVRVAGCTEEGSRRAGRGGMCEAMWQPPPKLWRAELAGCSSYCCLAAAAPLDG